MPKAGLRQWVLTVPFAWRSRLGSDGALLGAVVRKFADAVLAFYRRKLAEEDGVVGESGAVLVVQRTSRDRRRWHGLAREPSDEGGLSGVSGVVHFGVRGAFQEAPRSRI